jgi:hypothetical protein
VEPSFIVIEASQAAIASRTQKAANTVRSMAMVHGKPFRAGGRTMTNGAHAALLRQQPIVISLAQSVLFELRPMIRSPETLRVDRSTFPHCRSLGVAPLFKMLVAVAQASRREPLALRLGRFVDVNLSGGHHSTFTLVAAMS